MEKEFNSAELETLKQRAENFKKLGKIQDKYFLPSLSIIQFYAEKLNLDFKKDISPEMEKNLVQNSKKGEKIIIKNIREIGKILNLDNKEQENFYAMILDEGNLTDYFLSNNIEIILKKLESYNCENIDKLMSLIKEIDPEFDFTEYYKNYFN